MLYVEPAGGSPEMFSRGFKYLFFAQQATADQQGKVFAEWVAGLPEDQRPETAAYPTLDDPFAAPDVEGIKEILEEAGIETVYEETYAIDTKNFDTIVNAMKNADPDLVVHGAQFEDGIGMTRVDAQGRLHAGHALPDQRPVVRRPVLRRHRRRRTPRASCTPSATRPEADTPGNAEFVAKYDEMFGGLPPEDAADAFAAGEVLQAAVEAVGEHRRPEGAGRLAARERGRDDPRAALVERGRQPHR